MTDTQKPTEVPEATTTAPEAAAPAADPASQPTAAAESTPAATTAETSTAPATSDDKPASATTEAAVVVEATTDAPATEEPKKGDKEEVKPIEEGHLEHKGSAFPKNFIYSKKLFWFGSDPFDVKNHPTFKADKASDVAHHIAAWASHTGKGLLFFSEKDKSSPQGAVHLSDASEPVTEGTHKFHFTFKGQKHHFRAANSAERDNWVEQLKGKIAEAKELAQSVVESETYKKTIESLKLTKEEKAATTPAAEEPADDATSDKAETSKEEAKDEAKKEEPKRRSASRKRSSVFGNFFSKKDDDKKVDQHESKVAEVPALAAEAAPTADSAAEPQETAPEQSAEVEAKPEEAKVESPDVKQTPFKRASIFHGLSFGKKKAPTPEPVKTPTEEATPAMPEAVAAPVIPPVETTEPLSTDVSTPAAAPAESTEATPSAVGEAKKEVKNDKRKSSLPFNFGKKEKSGSSDDEADKTPKSPFNLSRLRATIKSKTRPEKLSGEKTEDKAPEAGEAETPSAPKEPVVAAPITEEPDTAEQAAADKPATSGTPVAIAAA